jgi:uncharacterized repeat protein (TIGR03803 family)
LFRDILKAIERLRLPVHLDEAESERTHMKTMETTEEVFLHVVEKRGERSEKPKTNWQNGLQNCGEDTESKKCSHWSRARNPNGKSQMRYEISPLFVFALCFWPAAGLLDAQPASFHVLHGFTATSINQATNCDGAYPEAGLVVSGGKLYGTANNGGSAGNGTVFEVNTDGSDFTNLYSFTTLSSGTNGDGANPVAVLVLSDNILYGTASSAGSTGEGTVFAFGLGGSGFKNLHNFTALSGPQSTNCDGAVPQSSLIISGSTLYGVASYGGSAGNGTVFRVNIDGSDFTNLHSFSTLVSNTNCDGANPQASLIISDGKLYGAALFGGSAGAGTVFRINTAGSDFTNLYSFTGGDDGADPYAGLIISDGVLYGTAAFGGSNVSGTVFSLNIDRSGFTNLYTFTGGDDGAYPYAGLIISNNVLYGTVEDGGAALFGAVFAVNTDGSGFTNLYNFNGGCDGSNPYAGLNLVDNVLYGTATYAGRADDGTVFALSLAVPPTLGIGLANNQVTISWPAWASNYFLQTTTNLSAPDWATVTNSTSNTSVTLANSFPAAFFRLQQQ